MKHKTLFLVSLAWTLVVLVAIWGFSAQGSNETTALSGGLARKIAEWLGGRFDVHQTEAVLRKLAHFTIFMALGIGLTGMLLSQVHLPVVSMVVLLGTVFAAADEIHQSFVPGRSPRVMDVLIDLSGVIVGMLLILGLKKLLRRRTQWAASE